LRSYRVDPAAHVVWAAAPFVFLLAYGVWIAQQGLLANLVNSTFSAVAVAAILAFSVALIGRTAATGGDEVLRVHAHGLADLRGGRAVPWGEVRAITPVWSREAHRVDRYVLTITGGEALTLDRTIGAVDQLVDELRARTGTV
jgi:hypothetical protein